MADQQAHIATLVNRAFNTSTNGGQKCPKTCNYHVVSCDDVYMFYCCCYNWMLVKGYTLIGLNVCYFFLYITSVQSIKPDVMKEVLH